MTNRNFTRKRDGSEVHTRTPGLRERIIDICEHILVMLAFLMFLSFVQSVTATQQELAAGKFINTGVDTVQTTAKSNGPGTFFRIATRNVSNARPQ